MSLGSKRHILKWGPICVRLLRVLPDMRHAQTAFLMSIPAEAWAYEFSARLHTEYVR